MAATREMVDIALKARPHAACIVPERRQELTTEGGLDVVRQHNHLVPIIAELKAAGIRVSLFIGADERQIETAAEVGAPVIEIHTGVVVRGGRRRSMRRSRAPRCSASRKAPRAPGGSGSRSMPATASICRPPKPSRRFPEIVELNIGHFLIGEAIFGGLAATVKAMRAAMDRGVARRL